jgi:hypothetical protein
MPWLGPTDYEKAHRDDEQEERAAAIRAAQDAHEAASLALLAARERVAQAEWNTQEAYEAQNDVEQKDSEWRAACVALLTIRDEAIARIVSDSRIPTDKKSDS